MKSIGIFLAIVSLAVASYVEYTVKQDLDEVHAYWTPERMANAIPMDVIRVNDSLVERQEPFEKPKVDPVGAPILGGTHFLDIADYGTSPYKVIGKVFFSIGALNYVCSGSSIGNEVVILAGHCVTGGQVFYTNFLFVPNFINGAAPFGFYAGVTLSVMSAYYFDNNNLGRDVAAAKVQPGLVAAVGSLPVTYNVPRGSLQFASGYPVPVYGGQRIVYTYNFATLNDGNFSPNPIGFTSLMQGGSSGGPWILGVTGASPAVNGVVSYGYIGQDNIFSPYFDSVVQTFVNSVTMKKPVDPIIVDLD